MNGFISVHRKILDNEIYRTEKFDKAHAWLDLLLLANYKPRTIVLNGKVIDVKPGQLFYSQQALAERWHWNFKTVKKFLLDLKKMGMVEYKTNRSNSVITIVNWTKYQNHGEPNGVPSGVSNAEQDGAQGGNKNIIRIPDKMVTDKKEINNKKDILNINNTISIERYLREFKIVNNKP